MLVFVDRDGSAIELVGLCKAIVTWLAELRKAGKYPHDGVVTSDRKYGAMNTNSGICFSSHAVCDVFEFPFLNAIEMYILYMTVFNLLW